MARSLWMSTRPSVITESSIWRRTASPKEHGVVGDAQCAYQSALEVDGGFRDSGNAHDVGGKPA